MNQHKGQTVSYDNTPKDPLEALYALNIGDFMADSFISDELLDKISDSLASDPEKLKSQLEELIQIYSIDKTLGLLGLKTSEGFILYDSVSSSLANMFDVDACHLFQNSKKDTGESYLSLTGTSLNIPNESRWQIGVQIQQSDFLGAAYLGETLAIADLSSQANWHPITTLGQDKTKSLLAAPLREGQRNMGLLLFESTQKKSFSSELMALADATTHVFVTSIRLQKLVAQAQSKIDEPNHTLDELRNFRAQITESIADLGEHQREFVNSLGNAVDARHNFTKGHSRRVASVAKNIAESMELNEKTIDLVYSAGLLGTIGKLDVPKQVLSKQEKLTDNEWESLRDHPNVGANLLAHINFLSEVVPYVHFQHERWDGSGSPEGRTGRNIPLGSRILAVADAYQAMTAERPYRDKLLSHDEAITLLQSEAGTKWDPDVLAAFTRISEASLS